MTEVLDPPDVPAADPPHRAAAAETRVARCYEVSGARMAAALLASRGIAARSEGKEYAYYIWIGDDLDAPMHHVATRRDRAEEARAILAATDGLDGVVDWGDELPLVPAPSDATDSDPTDPDPPVSPTAFLVHRARRAAMVSWISPIMGVFGFWNAVRAIARGLAPEDHRPLNAALLMIAASWTYRLALGAATLRIAMSY